jgi:hypothetical protein
MEKPSHRLNVCLKKRKTSILIIESLYLESTNECKRHLVLSFHIVHVKNGGLQRLNFIQKHLLLMALLRPKFTIYWISYQRVGPTCMPSINNFHLHRKLRNVGIRVPAASREGYICMILKQAWAKGQKHAVHTDEGSTILYWINWGLFKTSLSQIMSFNGNDH